MILVKPDLKYYEQYKEMMDEWNMEESRIAPWPLSLKYHTMDYYKDMLKRVEDVRNGIDLDGYSSSTTYWLYDDEKDILVGASNLRDKIVGESGVLWGHIGYGIRPSERKKGYATILLELTLAKAKEKGFNNIYVGSYVGNYGSWKVMEKCGFEFEKIIYEESTGLPVKIYKYLYKENN